MKMAAWLMLGLHKDAAEIISVISPLGADSKIVFIKCGGMWSLQILPKQQSRHIIVVLPLLLQNQYLRRRFIIQNSVHNLLF